MAQTIKLAAAVLFGIVVGAWGVPALRAQPPTHPAYVLAEVHVTDPAGFTEYVRKLPATLVPYHARTLARGLADTREGTPPDGGIAILAFDSLKRANDWYLSPAYQAIVPLRQKSATARVLILDGLAQ